MIRMSRDHDKLKKQLRDLKSSLENGRFESGPPEPNLGDRIGLRRELDGHFSKVYAAHWGGSGGEDKLVSCSQDGKILVWDAVSKNKTNVISPQAPYMMTCAFDQNSSQAICAGGLDNVVSIYRLAENEEIAMRSRTSAKLIGHDGYVSCARFMGEHHIVSSSGDTTCMFFDVTTAQPLHYFKEHIGDVMSVSPKPGTTFEFISGSVDSQIKLWDVRTRASAGAVADYSDVNVGEIPGTACASRMKYEGHESDVNCVAFMSNGFTFASGSDDASCRMFDIRCHQEINNMRQTTMVTGLTSVDFSKSGRLLFAAYEDGNCYGWDTLVSQTDMGEESVRLKQEPQRCSYVSVHSEGKALAIASWEPVIKIYA